MRNITSPALHSYDLDLLAEVVLAVPSVSGQTRYSATGRTHAQRDIFRPPLVDHNEVVVFSLDIEYDNGVL